MTRTLLQNRTGVLQVSNQISGEEREIDLQHANTPGPEDSQSGQPAAQEWVDSSSAGETDPLSHVTGRMDAIDKHLGTLTELFDRRLRYDAAKDKAFDNLYEKMKQCEGDFQVSLKMGLIRSLLLLYDNMAKTEVVFAGSPEMQDRITVLREELLEVLYAEGIEPIGPLGSAYDRKLQEALNVLSTDDATEDGTVAKVVREGFYAAGKVLRAQGVIVRRYHGSSPALQTSQGAQ